MAKTLDYKRTSFSRLEAYIKCPKLYKHRYIDKLPVDTQVEAPLIKGVFVHNCLQSMLDPVNPLSAREAIDLYYETWLEKSCLLELTPEEVQECYDFAERAGELFYRASPRATFNPIRNADGSVPKDVEAFPPKVFTNLMQEEGLFSRKLQIDVLATQRNPSYTTFSFAYLLASCFDLVLNFKVPKFVAKTIGVEIPFSPYDFEEVADPIFVDFPGREDLYWNGKIDWVFELTDGRLVIADHKTSKEVPTHAEVMAHPQLLVYAYLYWRAYCVYPDLLAINHLSSGKLVFVELDKTLMEDAIRYFGEVQAAIDKGVFPRNLPTSFNSPCLKRDWRSKKVKSICPYLTHCWPHSSTYLLEEDV